MMLSGNTCVPDDPYFIDVFNRCDVFEQENLDLALSFVKKTRVAIDGGAHVGSWTRYLAKRFHFVAAFEPNPENFECLCANTLGLSNVGISRAGLSATFGSFGLASGNNSGCWHLVEGDGVTTVPLPDYGALDFLKLDIEGHEAEVLKASEAILTRYRPIVLIEEKALPHKPLEFEARRVLEGFGFKELARIRRDVIFG
jgi:FkbM family methyltransferase